MKYLLTNTMMVIYLFRTNEYEVIDMQSIIYLSFYINFAFFSFNESFLTSLKDDMRGR